MLLLAACQQSKPSADTPGARLEIAAVARGLVPDPAGGTLFGIWANETDRLCVVPGGRADRIGARVDYGEGQGCSAAGTVERDGAALRITFGECRFEAEFDGERIAFPAVLPAACGRVCSGRASLTALTVERLSESVSEAAMLRGADGKPLCAG
ncbi:MAG: hypothetical protein JWN21_1087 [Sphingomonas bacterium]|nr:hypothetical protein [Sphingomonas bacterium]